MKKNETKKERRMVILQDKILKVGTSPIYNESYEEIGEIKYQAISLRSKVEILREGEIVSSGRANLFTLLPKWTIRDDRGEVSGVIKRRITLFKKAYTYKSAGGEVWKIAGDIWSRNFVIREESGEEVASVSTLSSMISLRPHTFAVEIQQNRDVWEVIGVVQGVRSLLKKENEAKIAHEMDS